MRAADGQVAKLTLTPETGGGPLKLPFNPTTFSFSVRADFGDEKNKDAQRQYKGRMPRQLSALEVRLDARTLTGSTVGLTVDRILGWLGPSAGSAKGMTPSPPVLRLTWGRENLRVVLTSAGVTYSMFAPDGQPLRGTVTLDLEEVVTPLPATNPTSGSEVSRHSHRVVAGDTLHSIATSEYGDPGHWRDVALANDIDDPMSLRPGTQLLLPPQADLVRAERSSSWR